MSQTWSYTWIGGWNGGCDGEDEGDGVRCWYASERDMTSGRDRVSDSGLRGEAKLSEGELLFIFIYLYIGLLGTNSDAVCSFFFNFYFFLFGQSFVFGSYCGYCYSSPSNGNSRCNAM